MKFEEIEDPKTSVLPPIRDESATFRATIDSVIGGGIAAR